MKHIYPLSTFAHARSGDKGSGVNVGVIAYTQKDYELLVHHLDTKKVADFFQMLAPRRVMRYELPNLLALNFILEGVLEGGGSLSLRIDAQGKALGQAILELPLEIDEID